MIYNYNKQTLLCCCSIISVLLSVMPARAETLDGAVRQALMDHPSVMAAGVSAEAAGQEVVQSRSNYLPQISAGTSFGRIFSDNTTTRALSVERGTGYSWQGEGNVALTQRVYDWSETSRSVDAALARQGASQMEYQGNKHLIAGQMAQAYIRLLRAKSMMNIALLQDRDMLDYQQRIQAAFDNGGADESQVSRAQDYVVLAKNALVQYEGDYQIALAYYKESMGRLPEGDLSEPPLEQLNSLPASLDEAVNIAMGKNPQVKVAEMQEQAGYYDQEKEKTNTLPKLNAELSYAKKDQSDLVGGESEDARALLRANWDYALGGAQLAAQERAALLKQKASFSLDAVQRTVERDVEVNWANLNLIRHQMKNNYDRFVATDKTLNTFETQYEGGQQKLLDLMTAASTKYSAQLAYMDSTYQEMGMVYALMTIIGIPFYGEEETMEYAAGDIAR